MAVGIADRRGTEKWKTENGAYYFSVPHFSVRRPKRRSMPLRYFRFFRILPSQLGKKLIL
jgi:hypothetical protein